jgi:hypothetical protein
VLADPKFFAIPIVLIHGGVPWHEIAIYLALKPNVWVDISAIGFLYPVPDFASVLRRYFAREGALWHRCRQLSQHARRGGRAPRDGLAGHA